ncbi:MAG: preprotein translocase subunit SecG [Zetaproteobacteria bacterium]|nr:preprotein translocase subunit SecG [Pseudobdellovibrionaceae bacterium]|tara:strand:+ start:1769 stop:2107 length:339 start_codon:yes stop_codon:yes gene_type:complete
MENFIITVHILVCLFMILVVLVQGGNQGGMGAAFGGGNTQGVFGATGATSFLGKLTYGAAAIFMVTSISLSILQGAGPNSNLGEKLQKMSLDKNPVIEAAPKELETQEKTNP